MEAVKCPLCILPPRSADTLWAGGGAAVWELPPAVLSRGTQLDLVGKTHQYTLKKSPWPGLWEQTAQSSFTEKPWQGLKLPAVRGHLSSAFGFKTIPGGTWAVLSTFLWGKMWFSQVSGACLSLQWKVRQAGGLWMGKLGLFLFCGIRTLTKVFPPSVSYFPVYLKVFLHW